MVGEVIVKGGHDFYSYESKYVDPEGSATKIPADLPPAKAKKMRKMAVAAFKAFSLRGMARVDFLARRDFKKIYVNEVNTIPGFTSISMYPKLWEASGLPLPKLDRSVDRTGDRGSSRARRVEVQLSIQSLQARLSEPMNRLLIATTNPRQTRRVSIDPAPHRDRARTRLARRSRNFGDAEENGETFRENALLKARFYFERAQIPTLADDGGLEVDALGGEPGVRSHRWLGRVARYRRGARRRGDSPDEGRAEAAPHCADSRGPRADL